MLFISDYPDDKTIRDGMLQRVKAIDELFEFNDRIYISISIRGNFSKRTRTISEHCIAYKVNLFLHLLFILKHLRGAHVLYYHSVNNVLQLLFLFLFWKRKNIVWDVHGAVPEEERMKGKRMVSLICIIAERIMIRNSRLILVVSNSMKLHLLKKYRIADDGRFVIYPIIPNTVVDKEVSYTDNEGSLTILYSGGVQEWQNVEKMMQVISRNLYPNLNYLILTGDIAAMRQYLVKYKIDEQVTLKSVSPAQLHAYYSAANYGFILRNDNVVNAVSCPTKLVEYMYYGIIPIVLSKHIGDFEAMDYECISYEDLSNNLHRKKSQKNRDIIINLINTVNGVNLNELILRKNTA